MRIPVATYRIQLNAAFDFEDASAIAPYLRALGVTEVYAAPILRSRGGSTHGYDVTNPARIDRQIGGERGFEAFAGRLRELGLGLLLDIVPNHMAASVQNPWWNHVLEHGQASLYADRFDIDWNPAGAGGALNGVILLPVLGAPYGTVLENGELVLDLDARGLGVRYYDRRLPLDSGTYADLLAFRLDAAEESRADSEGWREYRRLVETVRTLPDRSATTPFLARERDRTAREIKERLWRLCSSSPEVRQFIDENIRVFNGRRGEPESFALLDILLRRQAYRLAHFRLAAERINYRRFFDIADLVTLRTEDPGVFEATHALVLRLLGEGSVSGLRVDHVDGLRDPSGYLQRLQAAARETSPDGAYVTVEKILMGDEELPEEWPVAGTTGYDFLNALNGVMVDARGVEALERFYAELTGDARTFADVVYEQKKQAMRTLFHGEMRDLADRLSLLADCDRHARDILPSAILDAVQEATACCPVYRTYTKGFHVSPRDLTVLERMMAEVRRRRPDLDAAAPAFIERVFRMEVPTLCGPEQRDAWLEAVMRWQRVSGPIMAKGLEDTAFYVHTPLISLNEVGGRTRPLTVEEFHRSNALRKAKWPHALNATSTHDTKRAEDVRARLNILSEMPREWNARLRRWGRWNRRHKRAVNGVIAPAPSDEILVYQTLLGSWPLFEGEVPEFRERLRGALVKALREGKTHTSWLEVNDDYENAVLAFVDGVLDAPEGDRFLADFARLRETLAFSGAMASLSQVLLKVASPGVPDTYQGTELWDLSMVDPDNRRPVDYTRRQAMLDSLRESEAQGLPRLVAEVLATWRDGRVKLYLTSRALAFQRAHPDLFIHGDYLPLAAEGTRREHVVAFARRRGGDWTVAVAPRLVGALTAAGRPPLGGRVWRDTRVLLPEDAPSHWASVLTDESVTAERGQDGAWLRLGVTLSDFPVALLSGRANAA